jgi:hypothetical protein
MKISIRSQFKAPPGKLLIQVDLSQAESWIVAYAANEPNMKFSLNNSDIHRDTAGNALFYGDRGCAHEWVPIKGPAVCQLCGAEVSKSARYIGKRYNHASAYRMGPLRAAEVINKDSDQPPYVTVTVAESRVFYKNWHSYYNLKPWWSSIEDSLNRNNRVLSSYYGFTRQFFNAWGDELFKEATAFIPQSTVAAHFNGRIHPELGIEGGLELIYDKIIVPYMRENKLVNQSHDSCILEVPRENALDIAREAASYLARPLIVEGEMFTIPVDIEIGERWGELEELAA